MKITDGLIEQHIHGAFGFDFSSCSPDELIYASEMLAKCGITYFFPTLITDKLSKLKSQIKNIKIAMLKQTHGMSEIVGVHLEGPFINPEKCGVHNKKYILPLNIDYFNDIYDDVIKIVTLAPELDSEDFKFVSYLKSKGIKVSAGHTLATDLSQVNQVTHIFNAMEDINHKKLTTPLVALLNASINQELIADSVHVNDDLMRAIFTENQIKNTLLVSDALPLAHSDKLSMKFATKEIFNENGKIVDKNGVLAGSSMLLNDIIKNVTDKNIFKFHEAINMATYNQAHYHKLPNNAKVYWSNDCVVEKVRFI